MIRRAVVWGILVFGVIAGSVFADGERPQPIEGYAGPVEDRSHVCMLQDNIQREAGIEYVYQDKTYYLCCMGCFKGFDSDPERFSHATDPVGGEQVDKADAPVYAHDGRAYFFASEVHRLAFIEDPERYLVTKDAVTGRETVPTVATEGVPSSIE